MQVVFGYIPGWEVWWLGVVVKSNNSANSAQLSYASQSELRLAKEKFCMYNLMSFLWPNNSLWYASILISFVKSK